MKNKVWTVVIARPLESAELVEIPASVNALHRIVGGDIECTYPLVDSMVVVSNEDGALLGMAPNRLIFDEDRPVDFYSGPMVILGVTEDGDFRSLTDAEKYVALDFYGLPHFQKVEDEEET